MTICDSCHGAGDVLVDARGQVTYRLADAVMIFPCPECGGCGRSHCCEGERPGNQEPER